MLPVGMRYASMMKARMARKIATRATIDLKFSHVFPEEGRLPPPRACATVFFGLFDEGVRLRATRCEDERGVRAVPGRKIRPRARSGTGRGSAGLASDRSQRFYPPRRLSRIFGSGNCHSWGEKTASHRRKPLDLRSSRLEKSCVLRWCAVFSVGDAAFSHMLFAKDNSWLVAMRSFLATRSDPMRMPPGRIRSLQTRKGRTIAGAPFVYRRSTKLTTGAC